MAFTLQLIACIPNPEKDDLVQIERYLNRLDLPNGFLVIFDQRAEPTEWEARMQTSQVKIESGLMITLTRG